MKNLIYIAIAVIISVKLGVIDNPLSKYQKVSTSTVTTQKVTTSESLVTLYATSWCGYCKKTRALLNENAIAYTEYDIESSSQAKAEYDQLNGSGVPLLVINGEVVRGYNPSKILKLAKDL